MLFSTAFAWFFKTAVFRTKAKPINNSTHSRDESRDDRITLWLRRTDQLFLGCLLIALVILLGIFRWKLSGGGLAPIEIVSQKPREYFYAIDINRASWVEWAQLDGIGEKLSRRIVQDRDERGAFRTVDDLGRVRGVGMKLVDKLRPFLKCVEEEVKEPR